MDEEKTLSMKQYSELATKAFNFDRFCSIMEYAEPEEFEFTALKLYDLYARYIRRELRDLKMEERKNVEI